MEILDSNKYSKIYRLIYENVESKNGYVRQDFLQPLRSLKGDKEYEIEFNDLTAREDCGTIDQAKQTIDKAVSKDEQTAKFSKVDSSATQETSSSYGENRVLNSDYKHIGISIMQINAEVLKEFLNPNIEVREVTKELALRALKDRSSFFNHHLLPRKLFSKSPQVDLDINLDNQILEKKNDMQAKDAIKIIEQQTNDNVYFNLTFKSANEISSVLKAKVVNCSKLNIDFENILNGLNDELLNFHFDGLEKKPAQTLIELLRKQRLDFILKFKKLTNHQAKQIIEIAPIKQENIEISKVKTLRGLFLHESIYDLELAEFSARVIGTLNRMQKINVIIENVHDQLMRKLSRIDEETLLIEHISSRHCSINKEYIKDIIALLRNQGIIDKLGTIDENEESHNRDLLEELNCCDFNQFNRYKEEIIAVFEELHTNMLNVEVNELSETIKLISDSITEYAINITESCLTSS
ncbi:unnamed protein product [Rotaria sordida]|uniref:Uncharacterized protein n=1 Tax=Rotaria sordida TaxID=392033 RepID=A0A819NE70_9BILA|nr:unnamed protein product [Rotaria sordida]CAF3994499.1 unnamed protein product [Rotaria sordida]